MTTANETRRSLLRGMVLAVAVSAVGSVVPTTAEAAGELVEVQVVDRETGQAARVWRYGGRLFVAGRPGGRYSLRVTNHTPGRVMVVMSVDGVNVLTGQTAGYNQRGYVLEGYQSYDVSGWRKSDTEVAAFTFAPLPRSYAARTGRPADVGVIGVAAFTERYAPPVAVAAPEARAQADSSFEEGFATGRRAPPPTVAAPTSPGARRSAPADSMATQQRAERLGTGHGAREWSAVRTVAFERASSSPQMIRRIEYDSYDNLVARGVIRPAPRPSPRPRPFPSEGYVPDPPSWR